MTRTPTTNREHEAKQRATQTLEKIGLQADVLRMVSRSGLLSDIWNWSRVSQWQDHVELHLDISLRVIVMRRRRGESLDCSSRLRLKSFTHWKKPLPLGTNNVDYSTAEFSPLNWEEVLAIIESGEFGWAAKDIDEDSVRNAFRESLTDHDNIILWYSHLGSVLCH